MSLVQNTRIKEPIYYKYRINGMERHVRAYSFEENIAGGVSGTIDFFERRKIKNGFLKRLLFGPHSIEDVLEARASRVRIVERYETETESFLSFERSLDFSFLSQSKNRIDDDKIIEALRKIHSRVYRRPKRNSPDNHQGVHHQA